MRGARVSRKGAATRDRGQKATVVEVHKLRETLSRKANKQQQQQQQRSAQTEDGKGKAGVIGTMKTNFV